MLRNHVFLPVVCLLGFMTQSHAGFLDEVNNVLSITGNVLDVASGNAQSQKSDVYANTSFETNEDMARLSNSQLERLNTILDVDTKDPILNEVIHAAKNNVSTVLVAAACQTKGHTLNAGNAVSPNNQWVAPIIPFSASPRTECYNINNIGGWQLTSDNKLKFKAVFSSPSKGTLETRHAIMENEYGDWLLVYFGNMEK